MNSWKVIMTMTMETTTTAVVMAAAVVIAPKMLTKPIALERQEAQEAGEKYVPSWPTITRCAKSRGTVHCILISSFIVTSISTMYKYMYSTLICFCHHIVFAHFMFIFISIFFNTLTKRSCSCTSVSFCVCVCVCVVDSDYQTNANTSI